MIYKVKEDAANQKAAQFSALRMNGDAVSRGGWFWKGKAIGTKENFETMWLTSLVDPTLRFPWFREEVEAVTE